MSVPVDPFENSIDAAASVWNQVEAAGINRNGRNAEKSLPLHEAASSEPDSELVALRKQVHLLSQQIEQERQLNQKLLHLQNPGIDSSAAVNYEAAAQRTVQTLQSLYNITWVAVYSYHATANHFHLLAYASKDIHTQQTIFQPSMRQLPIRKAVETRKITPFLSSTLVNDSLLTFSHTYDMTAAPLFWNDTLRGLILFAGPKDSLLHQDYPLLEAAGAQLLNRWEYIRQTETLTNFVQTIATLSVFHEADSLMDMVASVARQALHARFTAVAVLRDQQWSVHTSGTAPLLQKSLNNGGVSFLYAALQRAHTFRLQDLTLDPQASAMHIDSPELRPLLVSPIHIDPTKNGLLLAWGKTVEESFSERDVFFAELLCARAAENLESCYLYQELRSTLKTTELLYDLSTNISQSEDLRDAARVIVQAARRLVEAKSAGIILFGLDGRKEAETILPEGTPGVSHPYGLIQQAMNSRQTIYLAESEVTAWAAIPIQTVRRCYGALWLEVPGGMEEQRHPAEEIRVLISQAAVALERSILLEETRLQAQKLVQANVQMNEAYMQTLSALMRALDVRDSETEGHSERVTELSLRLGDVLGLNIRDMNALKLGSLLHDIGKIGISDTILLKAGPLTDEEWKIMHQHPRIGASIIQKIPALHDALQVIAFHHERWDGSGYPSGLAYQEIPLLARIFAVVDVFDALTRDRPYRARKFTYPEALEFLNTNAGVLFDPSVVSKFSHLIQEEYPSEF